MLIRVIEKTGKLPSQIFLLTVKCTDRRTHGVGKAVDVFCGSLGDSKVALKHLRVFRMVVPSQRLGLEKVTIFPWSSGNTDVLS